MTMEEPSSSSSSSTTPDKSERPLKNTNGTKTHYEILGVDEKADHNMIKNAHRKLALRYHPDKRAQKRNVTAKQIKVDSESGDNNLDDEELVCKLYTNTATLSEVVNRI